MSFRGYRVTNPHSIQRQLDDHDAVRLLQKVTHRDETCRPPQRADPAVVQLHSISPKIGTSQGTTRSWARTGDACLTVNTVETKSLASTIMMVWCAGMLGWRRCYSNRNYNRVLHHHMSTSSVCRAAEITLKLALITHRAPSFYLTPLASIGA